MALSKEKEQAYIEKVKTDGCALEQIEEQTEAICLEAVKNIGGALKYVKEQTEAICLEAVKQDGLALEYVKDQTPEICLEAVKESGWALEYVNKKTEELKLTSLFDDFGFGGLDGLDMFYNTIVPLTNEMTLIYELLERWDGQLPSYQTVRLKLAVGEIELNQSPYHVLEQLYYH